MVTHVRLERPRGTPPEQRHVLHTLCAGDPDVRWIRGDNLAALQALAAEMADQITLAYLDPPFLTGRTHQRVLRTRKPQQAVLRALSPAFNDRWQGLSEYLQVLEARLQVVRTLLAPHGSVVIHVDPKTSHYVKVMCDELFGLQCFSSEIIWRYRRWPAKTSNFQRVHDVLLRYVKDASAKPRFNQLYEPLAASTLATWGTRKQRAVVDDAGRRRRSSTVEEASPGTPLGDVWDIGIVAPVARERTGYPTQKPEALLERLILSLSNPGDVVLDPYAGSGTTLSVAQRTERRAIGVDESAAAWACAEARLAQQLQSDSTPRSLWIQQVSEACGA